MAHPDSAVNVRESVSADAVADVRCVRRVDDLDRLELLVPGTVKQSLATTEQDRDDVEHEFVDSACPERLPHRRGSAGDVDVAVAGSVLRLLKGRIETCCEWNVVPPSISMDSWA